MIQSQIFLDKEFLIYQVYKDFSISCQPMGCLRFLFPFSSLSFLK